MGLLRGGHDVRGAVEKTISWLQATVTFVPYVTELSLPILCTSVAVVRGYRITTDNILTSHTLTTTFLHTLWACGLVRNNSLSYITVSRTCTMRHDCVPLPDFGLCLGTGDVVSVQDRTLFEVMVGSEHCCDLQVHILCRQVCSQDPKTPTILSTRAKTLIGSSFFSMTRSSNWRFHLDVCERGFGKNQLHSIRQLAQGELVSNTLLGNTRSAMLSMKQVHAMRARLTIASLKP